MWPIVIVVMISLIKEEEDMKKNDQIKNWNR